MILSVHQPNFIPWIGYFHKIASSDIFVILDQVQFPRGKSIANRNKIKTSNGIIDLVVPISHIKGSEGKMNYQEVVIADNLWYKKVLKTVYFAYLKSDFFDEVYSFLEEVFQMEKFCEMNIFFIKELSKKLNITTQIIHQSNLEIPKDLKNNELILNICESLKATTYLSGVGAKAYNDDIQYLNKQIELRYSEFTHPIYSQYFGSFVSHLSIIDVLFNIGFENTRHLIYTHD